MVKIEKEKKQDRLDKEFPPWEHVDFKYQTTDFFASVRSLKRGKLNPKLPAVQNMVTTDDIEEVFGPGGKLRTTNPYVDPKTLKALYNLFWRIWGRCEVKNNEFPLWLVHGYIAELMGEDIDWAIAAASTAIDRGRKKSERDCSALVKSRSDSGIVSVAPIGGEVTQGATAGGLDAREAQECKSGVTGGVCPYELSASFLERAEGVQTVVSDILERARRKVESMVEKKKECEEQIIGMKFNMQDRKKLAKAAEQEITAAEEDLKSLMEALGKQEEVVAAKKFESQSWAACTLAGERDFLEQGLRESCEEVTTTQFRVEQLKKSLEISRAKYEDKEELVTLGEERFREFEREKSKVDGLVSEATAEVGRFESEFFALRCQVQSMKSSGGVSFWPRPILHPPGSEMDLDNVLYVRPCGWCRRGFHCADIAVSSCKHFYHPYCLAEAFKETDECIVCGESLHPDWWASWGLGPEKTGMHERAKELGLDELQDRFKKLLQEDASDLSLSREFSWLHTSQPESSYDGCRSMSRRFSVAASSYSPKGAMCSNDVSKIASLVSHCDLHADGVSPLGEKNNSATITSEQNMELHVPEMEVKVCIQNNPATERQSPEKDGHCVQPANTSVLVESGLQEKSATGTGNHPSLEEASSEGIESEGRGSEFQSTEEGEGQFSGSDDEEVHDSTVTKKRGTKMIKGKSEPDKCVGVYSFAGKRKATSNHDLPPRTKSAKGSSAQKTSSNGVKGKKVQSAKAGDSKAAKGAKHKAVESINDAEPSKETHGAGWAPTPKQPKERWGVTQRPERVQFRQRSHNTLDR